MTIDWGLAGKQLERIKMAHHSLLQCLLRKYVVTSIRLDDVTLRLPQGAKFDRAYAKPFFANFDCAYANPFCSPRLKRLPSSGPDVLSSH